MVLLAGMVMILGGCMDFDDFDDSPRGNFEALWKIMDEHYCFFEEKGVNWDRVYREYSGRLTDNMSREDLFYLMSDMLREVRDGHVNLIAPFNVSRYDDWYQDSVSNFNADLLKLPQYLGRDYAVASGLKYKILDDNVGYIYYESFSSAVGEGNLDYVIKKFEGCFGIILDIRGNNGGSLNNVETLASRFTNEKVLTGYIRHKTGTGHTDFSDPYPRYIEPSTRLRYQKPVVLLTDRQCYSAANDFANVMKALPGVYLMGSTTGGGGGFPFSSELPNGWSVRFSTSPMFDANMKSIENGIAPDEYVYLYSGSNPDFKGDRVIERAREYIKQRY